MKIIVCIKQVPAVSQVEVDEETGTLKRLGSETKTNPYDLFAIEAALRLRAKAGGTVTALTMGPAQAEAMMKDAYMMGVDEAVILSDKKFAGSDVLATSYTLAQGIRLLEGADLIICGKQTTDGDTAQIGPAIAEHLGIPHAAWVSEITQIEEDGITIYQNLGSVSQCSKMQYPCLITVDKDIYVPRLPSYLLKRKTYDKQVKIINQEELPDQNLSRYGLVGSPTVVEKMFPPKVPESGVYLEGGSAEEKADRLFEVLVNKKFIRWLTSSNTPTS